MTNMNLLLDKQFQHIDCLFSHKVGDLFFQKAYSICGLALLFA